MGIIISKLLAVYYTVISAVGCGLPYTAESPLSPDAVSSDVRFAVCDEARRADSFVKADGGCVDLLRCCRELNKKCVGLSEENMGRKKIILASDLHYCRQNWLGVDPDVRMQKFIDDMRAEYEKEPFEALLLLGDYSLDHWKWQTKGSYLEEGISCTELFVDKYLSQLEDLPIEIRMIPGNHEQFGKRLWNKLTGHRREEIYVTGDWLFILMDTYSDGLNPTEHSDGIYTGADVNFIRCAMLSHPGKKVIICSHYIEPWKDTEAFCRILRNDRVKCLFAGHTHRSEIWHMEEKYGSKCVIFTGQYSEPGETPPTKSMWGYRRLILTDEYLESCYVTPQNTIVYNGETIVHPYGEQEAITIEL